MERLENTPPQINLDITPEAIIRQNMSAAEFTILNPREIPPESFGFCEVRADIQHYGAQQIDNLSDGIPIRKSIKDIANTQRLTGQEQAWEVVKEYFLPHVDRDILLNNYHHGKPAPFDLHYRGLYDQVHIASLNSKGKADLTKIQLISGNMFQELNRNKSISKESYYEALMFRTYLFESVYVSMPPIATSTVLFIRADTEHIQSENSAFLTLSINWNDQYRKTAADFTNRWDEIRDGARIAQKRPEDDGCLRCVYASSCRPELLSPKKTKKKAEQNGNGARQTDFFNDLIKFRLEGSETGKCSDCNQFVNITNQLHPDQSGMKLGFVRITQSFDCGCSHTLEVFEEQLTD